MCDTLVASGEATADGTTILAKNSDRHPNEAHIIEYIPPTSHDPTTSVQCTYVQVPQVSETLGVLLAKPFWIWGCEMGVNDRGVAIGNEAVFTKERYDKEPGLLGMDMARLALERAGTAYEALELLIDLLEAHGQGGNHALLHKEFYHNSFAIADPHEAWILETAGAFWAAERVRGLRTISNGLTIGGEWDRAGPGLVAHALEKGWCKSEADFDFARCYSDFLYTTLDGCRPRQARSSELLSAQAGRITVETMMSALRDHGARAAHDELWNPSRGWLMDTLCVHASFGPTRPSQSVGAMVAHLAPDLVTCWLTGTSGTCTSIFKPVYLAGAGLPELEPEPGSTDDGESLWWKHEQLHRAVSRDYATRMPLYRAERDALEAEFRREADNLYQAYRQVSAEERSTPLAAFTASCFARAGEATADWRDRVLATPVVHRPGRLFSLAWNQADKQAGFSLDGTARPPW